MLRLTDDVGRPHDFLVVDVHHHIGSEGATRNLNPKEPNGSYDFYRGIIHGSKFKAGLETLLRDEGTYKYFRREGEISHPHPALECLLRADERVRRTLQGSWAIDISVAFPMHDDFRSNEAVEYRASNKRLSKVVKAMPNSLRFVPWGRVNPSGGREACQEIERACTEDGIRGLKLHPKSDAFDLAGEGLVSALATAARRAIPVIFHTDWKSDRQHIVEALDEAVLALARAGEYDAVSHMWVILGHFGWSADHDMIGFLAHPCVHGEVSGLHGQGAIEFFKTAREAFPDHEWDAEGLLSRAPDPSRLERALAQAHTRDWSRKVMFGSDNPFLNQNNSIDVMGAILGRELDLTSLEVANILGLNAVRLFSMCGHGTQATVAAAATVVHPEERLRLSYSSDLMGGQRFLEAAMRGPQANVRSIHFSPVMATDPHARLLSEMGLLSFVDRDGPTVTLRSVLLEGLERTSFTLHHEAAIGPWTVADPLCQEVVRSLVAVSRTTPERELGMTVATMFLSKSRTDEAGYIKEA